MKDHLTGAEMVLERNVYFMILSSSNFFHFKQLKFSFSLKKFTVKDNWYVVHIFINTQYLQHVHIMLYNT